MKCKYCDADSDTTPGGIEMWECGTYVSFGDGVTMQSGLCQKNELARYRAMFPVPPWSTDAITASVCELLGMHVSYRGERFDRWESYDLNVSLRVFSDASYRQQFSEIGDPKTAGQLACLIAARKAST